MRHAIIPRMLRRHAGIIAFTMFLASVSGSATASAQAAAAELLMIRQHGCHWCILWDKEVGTIYPKSAEGRFAPLRQIDLRQKLPSYIFEPVSMTPTFILIEGEQEVGRIVGYPGDGFFWELLSDLLKKTSFRAPSSYN